MVKVINMPLFKDMLGSDESLFRNEIALDHNNYMPKQAPYRENQQQYIASCIKPLFQKRNGKNLLVYGKPGIGKTLICKRVLEAIETEEVGEEVVHIYINCWKTNTTFKIMNAICDKIGYKFTQNKRTEELSSIVKQILNKKSVVFCFDEIDKVEDLDFAYTILEDIYRKTIIFITNLKNFLDSVDSRLRSRLTMDTLQFKPYNLEETKGILKQRISSAFVPGVFSDEALEPIARKSTELGDIRTGLYMLREAGLAAENKSSRKITVDDAKEAIKKLDDYSIKDSAELEDDVRSILNLIKEHNNKKIGDLFKVYQETDGKLAYKSFVRKVKKLSDAKFISLNKLKGGAEGNTTIVNYKTKEKKLSDF